MEKPDASLLTSVFWGLFAFGRLFSVFLAHHLSPIQLILADLVGAVVTSIFLLSFSTSGLQLQAGRQMHLISLILFNSACSLGALWIPWILPGLDVSER